MAEADPALLNSWFAPPSADTPAPKPLKALGLLGVDPITVGIAHWGATHGLGIILHHEEAGALKQAVEDVRTLFREGEERGTITHAAAHKAMGGIGISTTPEDLEFCDIVIDAGTSDPGIAQAHLKALAGSLPAGLLWSIAVPANALESAVGDMADPSRAIGLVFSAPVYASEQVQINLGVRTSRDTAERALGLVRKLGKAPIINGPRHAG